MDSYDTLIHMSSETEAPLRALNNFLIYFLLWTGGGVNQPSFISINQLISQHVYDSGIGKYSVGNIEHNHEPQDFSNYRSQYLQGYWEVKVDRDYMGVSLKTAYPISKSMKVVGADGNWCYLTKYQRYSDSKEFYFIQMTQYFKGYFNQRSYKALSEMLLYIKEKYPGLYIITGDFNVQGHEAIFEHHLGYEDYHIVPFFRAATCNDNEGIASPDGIVVARELYPHIEYAIDFYPGYSYQHFIVSAKLYPRSSMNGTIDATSSGFKNYLQIVEQKHGNRDCFIGHRGIFDPKNNEMIGSKNEAKEVPIPGGGPKTYIASEVTKKLNNAIYKS